jgi:hypothetical protein
MRENNRATKEVYIYGNLPDNLIGKNIREAFVGEYNGEFNIVYIVNSFLIDTKKMKLITVDVGHTKVQAFTSMLV